MVIGLLFCMTRKAKAENNSAREIDWALSQRNSRGEHEKWPFRGGWPGVGSPRPGSRHRLTGDRQLEPFRRRSL